MKNNFLYNHLVAVQDRNTDVHRKKAYNRAVETDKTNRFYHNCIQNSVTLKDVIIELYYAVSENRIEEFKQEYDIEHFDKLCLLTLSMFYVDYIKFNVNPISDKIARITDFMFNYVSKVEPLVYELKNVNSVPSKKLDIKVEPKQVHKKMKTRVKVMSSPDLILFDSIKECNDYYNIKNTRHCILKRIKSETCGQTFRKIRGNV